MIRSPYDIVRIVLGLVLVAAAAFKGHQLATEPVAETSLLTTRWFLITVVELELLLGLALLLRVAPRLMRRISILVFALLASASLFLIMSGATTCGCFGRVAVSPIVVLIVDCAAIVGLWRCKRIEQPRIALGGGLFRVNFAIASLVWLLVGPPGAIAMVNYSPAAIQENGIIVGGGDSVVLETDRWTGKQFPLLPHIDIGDRLAHDRWLAVLIRHDCDRCQRAISNIRQRMQENSFTLPVALLEIPPYGDRSRLNTLDAFVGRLSTAKRWFVEAPVAFVLNEGRVVRVIRHFDDLEF